MLARPSWRATHYRSREDLEGFIVQGYSNQYYPIAPSNSYRIHGVGAEWTHDQNLYGGLHWSKCAELEPILLPIPVKLNSSPHGVEVQLVLGDDNRARQGPFAVPLRSWCSAVGQANEAACRVIKRPVAFFSLLAYATGC